MNKWTRVKFQPNLPLRESGRVTASKEHILLSKEAAKEGMVLLKNEKNLLPLTEGTRIALFGKGSFDYVKGGGGSGDVMVSYVHNLYDGLKMQENAVQIYEPLSDFYRTDIRHQYEKGAAPGMTVEPELSQELADGAKAFADVAVVVISRFSGEGWDRSSIECNNEFNPWDTETTMPKISGEVFPDGDFYLTTREKAMLSMVKERFDDIVVVLNIGGIMDLSWVKNDDRISSALLGWQGGMEGGLAMAELLTGKGNPSGKLADTFAADVNDYPSTANFHESFDYVNYTEDIYVGYRYFETLPGAQEKVIYPFGYGLSYTTFCLNTTAMWETEDQIFAEVQVTNTGNLAGKEVVQIYFEAPQGLLKKPARQLAAFAKTRLLQPGETQQIRLSFAKADMASYDDLGKIKKSAYILEKGTYKFYIGTSVRDTKESLLTMELYENMITKQLTAHLVPTSLKDLADPVYEGQIAVTDILSSSTAWLMIQALVDAYGEDGAEEVLSGIYENAGAHIETSGSGPLKLCRAGEVAIGFGLRHQAVADKADGLPIDYVDPEEGNFSLTESVAVLDKGEESNPLAMEMAQCIIENARKELIQTYPNPLYEGETADPANQSAHPSTFAEPLTFELFQAHQELSERAKG